MKGREVYVVKGNICRCDVLLSGVLGQWHDSFYGKVVGNRVKSLRLKNPVLVSVLSLHVGPQSGNYYTGWLGLLPFSWCLGR